MLEECNLRYNAHRVEIGPGAKKPADLLRLNPLGTIPTIIDHDGTDGRPIILHQSGAILLYLASKTGKFVPKDFRSQAVMYQWLMFAMTDVAAMNTAMYLANLKFGVRQSAGELFEIELIKYLHVCDERLADSAFLGGPELTIADIALFPVTVSRRALLDQMNDVVHLKRWAAKIASRQGVQRALAAIS